MKRYQVFMIFFMPDLALKIYIKLQQHNALAKKLGIDNDSVIKVD